jgi:hypothetical protein
MLVDGDGYGVDLMKWGGFGELLDDVWSYQCVEG